MIVNLTRAKTMASATIWSMDTNVLVLMELMESTVRETWMIASKVHATMEEPVSIKLEAMNVDVSQDMLDQDAKEM